MEPKMWKVQPKKVRIVVEKIPSDEEGNVCHILKEGQVFTYDFDTLPGGFCASAWNSIYPALHVIELGGSHPWDKEPGVTRACCPDQGKPVTFRIETYE